MQPQSKTITLQEIYVCSKITFMRIELYIGKKNE